MGYAARANQRRRVEAQRGDLPHPTGSGVVDKMIPNTRANRSVVEMRLAAMLGFAGGVVAVPSPRRSADPQDGGTR